MEKKRSLKLSLKRVYLLPLQIALIKWLLILELLNQNTYETGTILCQPSAASNLTKMYSSDLITLNYGIDDVYYQAADGLHKQDAAIIKDGVVTDI